MIHCFLHTFLIQAEGRSGAVPLGPLTPSAPSLNCACSQTDPGRRSSHRHPQGALLQTSGRSGPGSRALRDGPGVRCRLQSHRGGEAREDLLHSGQAQFPPVKVEGRASHEASGVLTQALSDLGCSPSEAVMIGDVRTREPGASSFAQLHLWVTLLRLLCCCRTSETTWAGLRMQECWEFWSEPVRTNLWPL